MTTTEAAVESATETPPASPANTWTAQFTELKSRYPKVREPILVALHILTQNPAISLDDAKAQAALHGTRITAASVKAARRLLSQQQGAATASTEQAAHPARKRGTRRPRAAAPSMDVEGLVRQFADQVQAESRAEADRLRAAMREAIAVLQAAVEGSR